MKCKFLAKDNACTGKYSGFSCIKAHCTSYRDSQNCEFHEMSGDYCRKYQRFGCVGKDSCKSIADYLDAVSEEV